MIKVQLKAIPSLSNLFNESGAEWIILEREMVDGCSIADLLADISESYAGFRKIAFDPDTGKVSDQLDIVHNDKLLPSSDVTEIELKNGDVIILLPTYTGG
ncbi:MoaD/ThiS family protein [Thermodesulfobacteriota bacterium]